MPRRKQNVDAFGKSWSPIDLPNLEKAVKLYERLNYLQDHFANSLSGSNKIMAQINEQAEIKEELQKLGIKHNEEELKQIIKLIQQRQNENRIFQNRPQGSTYNILTGGERTQLYGNNYKYNQYNGVSRPQAYNGTLTMNNWGQFYQRIRQSNFQQSQYNRAVQNEIKALKDRGSIMSEKSLKTFAEKNISSGKMTKETSDILQQSGKDFSLGASLLNVAANTFSKAVSTFTGLFFKGLDKQAATYENTFTNISVRTGTTRAQYFQNQTGTASDLYGKGLAGNVAVSEVQEMWNKLADIGMNQEQMFTRALDNVLTNKIVPYLDTTSTSFNILNERLDGKFVKDIRGINRLNNEIAGNNYLTSELLQELIDEMQPVSDAALEQLVQGSAEMTAMINKLTPKMGAEAAKSYVTQLYKTQKYSDQILNSGSLTEQKTLIDAIQNGVNIYDPTQFNDFIALAGNNTGLFTNMGQGYTSTMNGLVQNVIGSATGETYARMRGYNNLTESGLTFNALKELTDLTPEDIKKASEEATADYTNNVNNTLKQIQENELENLSTWLAAIYEQVGYWGNILSVLVKGIAGVVGAKIVGGIGKKLLGLGGGSGSSLLSTVGSGLLDVGLAAGYGGNSIAGGIATGALTTAGAATVIGGGTALGVAGISDSIKEYQSGQIGRGTASAIQGAAGLGAAGVAVGSGIAAAAGGAGLAGGIAAAATNPIGWALLIVAGGIAVGKSLWDAAHNYEKAGEKVEQEFNQVAQRLDQEQMKREENLLKIKDNLEETSDVEKARNDLIASGVLSAEDEKKWRDMSTEELKNNKDALVKLTDQYIKSTKDFSNAEQELLEQIKSDKVEDANEAAKSIKTWFEDVYKGEGGNTNANNEVAKNLILNMASTLEAKGESNWSDDEKKFMERYRKNSRENKFGYNDLRWILEGGGSWWGISNAIMDNTTDLLTNTGFALYANNRGANIKGYTDIDMNMLPYATEILQATSKEEAEEAVKKAKEAGMVYSEWKKYIGNSLTKWGIPSFRSGLSYVPYDDYLANLHEGEAVITAATANELRSLITTYRESQQNNINLDTAIQNQTIVLVNKLNEVISTIEQINSPFGSSSSIVSEMSKSMSMLDNMKYMRSTKSFNQ